VSQAPASGKQTLKLEATEQSAPAEREPSTDGQSKPAAETAPAAQSEQTEQNADAGQKTTSNGSAAQALQRSSSMQPAVQAEDQPATAPAPATDGKVASPPAVKPQTEAKQQGTNSRVKVVRHVVQKGETLFKLSRQYYGNNSGVARIARYNGFSPDTELVMGKVILIPLSQ
jgi:nucleoid-associated protein YgaU